jgi:uncharacterized protein (UPF0147 family)
MNLKRIWSHVFVVSVVMLYAATVGTLSGCEPLRKKFVRQKKKDKEAQELIPIFEPLDYGAQMMSAEERYKHFYSMWKIWNGDLIKTIDESAADKIIKYNVEQSILQLLEMRKWLKEEKQVEIDKGIKVLQSIGKDLEMPAVMRNNFQIKLKVERNAKTIRKALSPDVVKETLVNP